MPKSEEIKAFYCFLHKNRLLFKFLRNYANDSYNRDTKIGEFLNSKKAHSFLKGAFWWNQSNEGAVYWIMANLKWLKFIENYECKNKETI